MPYLYTVNRAGELSVREGYILRKKQLTDSEYTVFAIAGTNQRVVVSRHAGKIHNSMMWSVKPERLTDFYEKMSEIMLERENYHRSAGRKTQERRMTMRVCYENMVQGGTTYG